MRKLTTYLTDWLVARTAYCPDNPRCMNGASPLPENQKIRLSHLRKFYYHLWRMVRPLYPIQDRINWIYQSADSVNHVDRKTWYVMAADGNQITLAADNLDDPRKYLIGYRWFIEPEFAIAKRYVPVFGTIQPGDVLTFRWPSALELKATPTVTRIVEANELFIVVEVDQDISEANTIAYHNYGGGEQLLCDTWRCFTYEPITPIRNPRYFLGGTMQVTVTSAELAAMPDINGVGIGTHDYYWRFKNPSGQYTMIMDPTQDPEFLVQGHPVGGGDPEDISAFFKTGHAGRLRMFRNAADNMNVFCIAYFGDMDAWQTDFGYDLAENYEAFTLRYTWIDDTSTGNAVNNFCDVICKHALEDHTKSVGNMGDYITPVPGTSKTTIDGVERHFYCAKREYDTYAWTFPGGFPTLTPTTHTPTGLQNFPENGPCMQYGHCDAYEPIPTGWTFTVARGLARYLKEIWMSTREKIVQGMPGLATARSWTVHRVGNTSMRSVFGDLKPEYPVTMNQRVVFPFEGPLAKEYELLTDIDDNQYVKEKYGLFWNVNVDWATVAYATSSTYPANGILFRAVSPVHVNPQNRVALNSGTDPLFAQRNYVPRNGWRIEYDTGLTTGPGFPAYSVCLEDWETIEFTHDLLGGNGVAQEEENVTTYNYATPVTVLGQQIGAAAVFNKLIQDTKTETNAGSAVIHAIDQLPNNEYAIHIRNAMRSWSYIGGDPGARYDVIKNWYAGGHFWKPPFWMDVWSYYDQYANTYGSPWGGCSIGDFVQIPETVSGTDLSEYRFPVVGGGPHQGDTAADWGTDTVREHTYIAPGAFPDAANAATIAANTLLEQSEIYGDIHGQMYPGEQMLSESNYSAGATSVQLVPHVAVRPGTRIKHIPSGHTNVVSSVSYTGGSELMTINFSGGWVPNINDGDAFQVVLCWNSTNSAEVTEYESVTRPAPANIPTGKYWRDGNLFLFSADDGADSISFSYTVEGKDPIEANAHVATYLIPSGDQFYTSPLNYASWTSGTTVLLKSDGSSVTHTKSDSGGYLRITTGYAVAGQNLTYRQTIAGVNPDAPGNVGRTNDYNDYGKKMDLVIIKDDVGVFAQFALENKNINCVKTAGVIGVLDSVKYNYNNSGWLTLSASNYIYDPGRGIIHFKNSFIDSLNALENIVQFKVKLKTMDHRARPHTQMWNLAVNLVNDCAGRHDLDILPYGNNFIVRSSCRISRWYTRGDVVQWDPNSVGYNTHHGIAVGASPILGISWAETLYLKWRASEFRWFGRGNVDWSLPGVPFVSDTSDVTLQDFAPGAPENDKNVHQSANMYIANIADPCAGDTYPDTTYRSSVASNPANRFTQSYVGGLVDFRQAAADGLDIYHPVTGALIQGLFWHGAAPGGDYPILGMGPELISGPGVYSYENWPLHYNGSWVASGRSNFIGSTWTTGIRGYGAVVSASGTPITFGKHLREWPDGTTVEKAYIRVRTEGLERRSWVYTPELPEEEWLPEGPYVETIETTAGWVLLGLRFENGVYHWDVLSNALGGVIANNKWQYVDITQIINDYLSMYRKSKYSSFALCPSAVASVVNGEGGQLARIFLPSITVTMPEIPEEWDKPAKPPGYETPLPGTASGAYVTWDGVSIGHAYCEGVRFPDNFEDYEPIFGHWPPMTP